MKIIIAGAHDIGSHLAKLLSKNNHDIVLMDEDEDRLDRISPDYDLLTMHASPSSLKALKEAGAEGADLYIAVTPDESKNMNSCVMAKAIGTKKTVAKVDNYEFVEPELSNFFEGLGIDSLIYPENLAANDIVNGLKMSWVRQRLDVHGGALVMLGVKLRETCEILDQPLKELCKPDSPYYIVAIRRDGDTIIPRGDDSLKVYDMAYFMTTKQYIPYVRKIVGKEHYVDVKNVMIMGAGNTAVRALENMPEYMNVKVIEHDEERCEQLNEQIDNSNVMVINGDGRDLSLLNEEGILACLTAKRMGVRKTVAAVENLDYVNMAVSLDIGTIINKKAIAASHIYQMMLDTEVSNVSFLMTANAHVAEFVAQPQSKVTRKKVYELGLPKGATIGGLVRNGEGFLVSGGTQIEAGDIVVVFCYNQRMDKLEKFFK